VSGQGTVVGADGLARCPWGLESESLADYRVYHDTEWGRPVRGDDALYERICLEAFQSGLSWLTILRRREGFRAAFADFRIKAVAEFTEADEQRLLADPGIIRNRLKIAAAVSNAKAFLEVRRELGSFDRFVWQFIGGKPKRNRFRAPKDIPAFTPESDAMSRELKRRGFSFVGSTICYAFMQAAGMVNDHLVGCYRWREIK